MGANRQVTKPKNARLDERALSYFQAVCESGSMRAAGNAIRIAPSAISRKISELEANLGIVLLEKGSNGVRPTKGGVALLKHVRDRQRKDSEFLERLTALREIAEEEVRMAVGEGYLSDFMENGVKSFRGAHPNIHIQVNCGGTEEIVRTVTSGRVDLGIAFNVADSSGIRVLAESFEPLCVIAVPSHPLARRSALKIEEVGDYPCAVMSPQFGVRSLIDAAAKYYGLQLDQQMESNTIRAMLEFVRETGAITFLPAFAAGPIGGDRFRAIPLVNEKLSRINSRLFTRMNSSLPTVVAAVADHLAQTMRTLSPQ